MKTIHLHKGLDIPISGVPTQQLSPGNTVGRVAVIGDDYPGMKPTMLVSEGEKVSLGQKIFLDKKNDGVIFTAPGSGTVTEINRGERRKFVSLVIDLEGADAIAFLEPGDNPDEMDPLSIRDILVRSGLWTLLRTRPYGKTPGIETSPASLFITAIDSSPLAPDPLTVLRHFQDEYQQGLRILRKLVDVPVHYCTGREQLETFEQVEGLTYWSFQGPHPAGLPSTHIHFIDPVSESRCVWHIGYQDVIGIGHLFLTGRIPTEKIISLAGPGAINPRLMKTRIGASLPALCRRELNLEELRVISGSVLAGREATAELGFLGRFHNQVSVLEDSSGRSLFNWLLPGRDRFSIRPAFLSSYLKKRCFKMNTALWGGHRAIYPLGTYDEVMPLDIIATSLLKALSHGDTEKSQALGCLEIVEEDLGLCGFVCPGKNEFGQHLREVLTMVEQGG
jgi:Na+-transporting NADH:ubiquinone oxidoreductase subunit A